MPEQKGKGGTGGGASQEREPFVSPEDRPEVKIDPNKPLTELRVRDLSEIFQQLLLKKWELKEPFKDLKEPFKDWKEPFKDWKEPVKDHKDHKLEKWEIKHESKDLKSEKFEHDPIVKGFEIPQPGPEAGGDPIQELIAKVNQLQMRLNELQAKIK